MDRGGRSGLRGHPTRPGGPKHGRKGRWTGRQPSTVGGRPADSPKVLWEQTGQGWAGERSPPVM